SLHCPLTEESYHLIDKASISTMKDGVVIVNTSRGALINAEALLEGIKSKKIGGACLDVYEEESELFFEDNSNLIVNDDVLALLMTMPNVIVSSHQAFFTKEALSNIASTTIENIDEFFKTGKCKNEVL
ncbi:MAG: 2-hydroxyacid dehydrogenase, partial [Clostridia bacterium]|nr:2-hydroxyacid dehydrogenase [Clostridia bacterium]